MVLMITEKLKWKRVVPLNNAKPERDETGEWYDQAWENEQGGEILPRSEHATVVMGKKIIIIGGMGAHFVRDDICIIDTGTLSLSLSLTHTHPSARI
jgi:hypothetical protein